MPSPTLASCRQQTGQKSVSLCRRRRQRSWQKLDPGCGLPGPVVRPAGEHAPGAGRRAAAGCAAAWNTMATRTALSDRLRCRIAAKTWSAGYDRPRAGDRPTRPWGRAARALLHRFGSFMVERALCATLHARDRGPGAARGQHRLHQLRGHGGHTQRPRLPEAAGRWPGCSAPRRWTRPCSARQAASQAASQAANGQSPEALADALIALERSRTREERSASANVSRGQAGGSVRPGGSGHRVRVVAAAAPETPNGLQRQAIHAGLVRAASRA